MTQYEELKSPYDKDRYEREKINKEYNKAQTEYYKNAIPGMKRSKGSSEALRKYELAKRDYAKASLLGKAYLKLTGQANFKKMLEEANRRGR